MITLVAAVDDFMLSKQAGKRAVATLKWYAALLKPYVHSFGTQSLDTITMRDTARWLIEQSGSQSTACDRDKVLRIFWAWSCEVYQCANPMKAISIPSRPEPEPKAIEVDDLNALIDACRNDRDRAILITLADCGLRASGLISLSIDDIDFSSRMIRVTEKRGRMRSVPFSLDTERVIVLWCKRRPFKAEKLFCALDGDPLTYWGLREIVRRLAVRAGFTTERCNLHSLRHFAAREYLRQGGSLPAVQRILGHKTIDTTARYYAVYGASELSEVHDAHSPLNSLKRKESI